MPGHNSHGNKHTCQDRKCRGDGRTGVVQQSTCYVVLSYCWYLRFNFSLSNSQGSYRTTGNASAYGLRDSTGNIWYNLYYVGGTYKCFIVSTKGPVLSVTWSDNSNSVLCYQTGSERWTGMDVGASRSYDMLYGLGCSFCQQVAEIQRRPSSCTCVLCSMANI